MNLQQIAIVAVVIGGLFLTATILIMGQAVGFQIDPAQFH